MVKRSLPPRPNAYIPRAERPTSAVAVAEPEDPEEEADVAELVQLGQELANVARDKARRSKVLDEIDAYLDTLKPEELSLLIDHPVVQKFIDLRGKQMIQADDPPGTIYLRNGVPFTKKPWTEAELRKSDIEIVEFELEEPVDFVGWQGLRRSYGVGTHRDYACFVDQLKHKKRETRFAKEHAEFLMGRGPATHRDMMDPGTMLVRATATGGGELVVGATMNNIAMPEGAA